MPQVRRTVQDHAAVREVGGVTPTPATRAAVTAAVLLALELAAELLPVRVWGVVEIRKERDVKKSRSQNNH